MIAYCYQSGRIEFGQRVPKGALPIATAPARQLRNAIAGFARMSYPSKPGVDDEVPLVPGIPEASDENERLDALFAFRKQIAKRIVPPTKHGRR